VADGDHGRFSIKSAAVRERVLRTGQALRVASGGSRLDMVKKKAAEKTPGKEPQDQAF